MEPSGAKAWPPTLHFVYVSASVRFAFGQAEFVKMC